MQKHVLVVSCCFNVIVALLLFRNPDIALVVFSSPRLINLLWVLAVALTGDLAFYTLLPALVPLILIFHSMRCSAEGRLVGLVSMSGRSQSLSEEY